MRNTKNMERIEKNRTNPASPPLWGETHGGQNAYVFLMNDSALWASENDSDLVFKDWVAAMEEQNRGKFEKTREALQNAASDSALAILSRIIPNGDLEAYELAVLDIYNRKWMADSTDFDEVEMQVLALIANLSLEAGGKSIFGARTLLGGDFNNMESKQSQQKEPPKERGILVYPNPNNGFVLFKLSDASQQFIIEIFDTYGRTVAHYVLNGITAAQGIDIRHLSNGVYFYKIHYTTEQRKNGIIILKK